SKILDRADAVAVLSEKDAAMLPAGVAEVVVVPPVVHSPRADDQQTPRAAGDVIFVGAMRRPENNTAALWLIRDIWPLVRGRIETCRLLIVGSEPSDEVISAAAEMD